MAPPKVTARTTGSPAAGRPASAEQNKTTVAMKLYNWCRKTQDEEYIFSQQNLLDGGIIPKNDAALLIEAVQSLVNERLFRTHDLRVGGVGWKVVAHVSAEKYKDLSSDESLVYSVIESAAKAGAWTKTIKIKLNLHQKNVDAAIKTLVQRGYIRPMSTVKFPNRKMYILAGLQPGEDAMGGAWFTDGMLDQEMLEFVALAVETQVSNLSWTKLDDDDLSEPEIGTSRKRKHRLSAEAKGKKKVRRLTDDSSSDSDTPIAHVADFMPHPPDYTRYPTAYQLTEFINTSKVIHDRITVGNMIQLLDIMVYDDKLIKIPSPISDLQTTYKARRNPGQVKREHLLREIIQEPKAERADRLEASRKLELQVLGRGGMSEIPCGRCPVFDQCEPDGPINATNCEYFEQWFEQMEKDEMKREGLDF